MSEENTDDKKGRFDSEYYFKLGDAVDDVSMGYGAKEKAIAGAKLAGKTLFNVALFSGKFGLEVIKGLPDAVAKQAGKKK
jgi:hypothetical protein